jgi:uncharacterized protein (DUF2225 family)
MRESVKEFFVQKYGIEYFEKIWSPLNKYNPDVVTAGSGKKIWLRCLNDETHPDYDLKALNIKNSYRCPYCSGRRTCKTNSFGFLYPDISMYWSEKNTVSPFDCRPQSHDYYWFQCENGIHDDYQKRLYNQVNDVYLCPQCATKTRIDNIPRGENSPYWKGEIVDENRRARDCWKYDEWRDNVFNHDDYTCQCCGNRGGRLNAHHIKDFAQYKDLRYDLKNGITLCENCHDANISGSFHNIYGTHYKTPIELEQYINNKRQQLGINIPFTIDSYLSGNILKPGDVNKSSWIFDIYSINELRSKSVNQKIMTRFAVA